MKSSLCIFIILFLIYIDLTADTNGEQKVEKKTIEHINVLNNQAEQYMLTNVELSIKLANEALQMAKTLNDDTLIINSLFILGKSHYQIKSYPEAKKYFLRTLDISKAINNQIKYIASIFELGQICYDLADYNNAMKYYEECLRIGVELRHGPWHAISLDAIGATHYATGNYEKALFSLTESLKVYEKLNDYENVVRILYGKGAVFTALSQYDKAIDYLLESLQMSQEKKHHEYEALSIHAIAIIYERLKNYQFALGYNKQALRIAEKSKVENIVGDILLHMGKIYFYIALYDTAHIYAMNSLKVQERMSDNIGIANAFGLLGDIFLKRNNHNIALEYYLKSWNLLKNVDQKYWQTRVLNHLGVIYTKMLRYELAQKHLHKSLNEAKKIGTQDLVMESLTALSEFYASTNDYKKAFEYLNEFTHLNDSIFTSSSHHIAEMQMRYETGKREKENELLKNKIDIQNLEIEKSYLQNWLSYLSLAIVSIIGFFSYHRYKAKKKANILLEQKIQDAIKKHQKQQEIIFHQANLSSLGELAAGMAHEINQPLQAIKLSAESLDLELRNTNVEHALITENISEIYQSIDRAKSIIDHVRIFASQQKNQVKEHFNPTSVIDNALSLIGKQYIKKEIFFNLKLNKRIGKIRGNPYKYEQIIFNLLSNAKDALLEKEKKLNQSYRKEIDIRLYREENDLVLLIKDNGIGMGKDQQDNIFSPFYTTKNLGEGTGLGLSIVFGLVKEMNGHILVTSDYDSGTTVKVCIPKAIARKYKVNSNSQT